MAAVAAFSAFVFIVFWMRRFVVLVAASRAKFEIASVEIPIAKRKTSARISAAPRSRASESAPLTRSRIN
jgi:hypothetical protein